MQYYFFPTDFYYPKPPSSIKSTTDQHRRVVPLKAPVDAPDSDADVADQNSTSYKIVKVRPLTIHLRTQNFASKCNVIYKWLVLKRWVFVNNRFSNILLSIVSMKWDILLLVFIVLSRVLIIGWISNIWFSRYVLCFLRINGRCTLIFFFFEMILIN